jgi:tRNA (guanine-N7-)-methyltransferase
MSGDMERTRLERTRLERTRTERTRTERTRTYVRRRGRMTRGQARAMQDLSPRYLVYWGDGTLDLPALFGRNAPLGLEIGFGMGQALVDWALRRPDWNLLGIEVYEPGLGAAMLGLEQHDIHNVRLLGTPAEDVLEHALEDASLSEVRIFFPDPWPKKRHHKRRLIQPDLARMLVRRLRPDGVLWVATDWQDYACWIADVLDGQPELRRAAPGIGSTSRPRDDTTERPRTRFEARGLRLGHQVWDLRYVRKR